MNLKFAFFASLSMAGLAAYYGGLYWGIAAFILFFFASIKIMLEDAKDNKELAQSPKGDANKKTKGKTEPKLAEGFLSRIPINPSKFDIQGAVSYARFRYRPENEWADDEPPARTRTYTVAVKAAHGAQFEGWCYEAREECAFYFDSIVDDKVYDLVSKQFIDVDAWNKLVYNASKEVKTELNPRSIPVDLGAPESIDGGYLLAPKSILPIQVMGANQTIISSIFNLWNGLPNRKADLKLAEIILEYGLTFPQVDEYVQEIGADLIPAVERDLQNPNILKKLADDDYDEDDYRVVILERLIDKGGYGCADSSILFPLLFEKPQSPLPLMIPLHSKGVSYSVLRTYFSAARHDKLHHIPADHGKRSEWDGLASIGLAVHGEDIPVAMLASKLKVADIKAICPPDLIKPSYKKAELINVLIQLPDFFELIKPYLDSSDYFVVLKPVDVELLKTHCSYALSLARIISDTYNQCIRMAQFFRDTKKSDPDEVWQITADSCCPSCKALDGKEYKTKPKKLPPYHVGCNCDIDLW